jgi:hypothetical protein
VSCRFHTSEIVIVGQGTAIPVFASQVLEVVASMQQLFDESITRSIEVAL